MKNRTKLARILYREGYGSISALAKTMCLTPSGIYRAMQKDIIDDEKKQEYTLAINKTFDKQYNIDDVFPIPKQRKKYTLSNPSK